ncbi:hypothetical protein FGE12_25320 [Aggregicoccus sp. 17bor-14]|uniref:hypothetical protein n=1 Tax=Myxococcaceae TaxID=31 RepID=UPI00129D01B7|nr:MULTISPECIES: hypothetical protein [Myxococcaceae]MBF5045753.1 hypothetical protein [Simulacricoccus sp. 17bor-14]MRI91488.1 hypothetical protein [Aggregicoccus sp. 17bor-14]
MPRCRPSVLLPSLLLLLLSAAPAALAAPLRDVVDGNVPGARAPFALAPEDYEVRWVGEPLPGVRVALEPGRLQWLRSAEVLVVPRGRLLVQVEGASGGALLYAGALHPLVQQRGGLQGAIPVALVSGAQNAIALNLRRGGETLHGQLELRLRPDAHLGEERLAVDASCSPFELQLRGLQAEVSAASPEAAATGDLSPSEQPPAMARQGARPLRADSWVSVGCRLVALEGRGERTSSLELTLLWDNVGSVLEVGGVEVPAGEAPVWTLRLPPGTGSVTLEAQGQQLQLDYRAPEHPRLASLGLGVGPYLYHYSAPGVLLDVPVPVLTLYASYALSRSARVVSFAAVTPSSRPFGDIGLYLRTESFTLFDRRLAVAVFLGGHLSVFRDADGALRRFALPQGAEVAWVDALRRGGRLLSGALVYPGIGGRSYYNAWLRWGVGSTFVELNYISVREPLAPGGRISLRTYGVSVGLPLASFL